MRQLLRTLLPLAALGACALPAAAAAAQTAVAPAREFAPRQLLVKFEGQRPGRALPLSPGAGVRRTAATVRQNPRVVYAEPNYIATASAIEPTPYDPSDSGSIEALASAGEVGK